MKHWNIRVTGKVQGVSYREFARRTAVELGVAGRVRNMPDGSVEIEVEGTKHCLTTFLERIKEGSRWSRVEQVEVEEGEMNDYQEFLAQ